MQTTILPVALAGLALAVAGCGGSSSSSSGSGSSSGSTSTQNANASSNAPYGTSSSSSSSGGGASALKLSADPNGGLRFTKTHLTAKAGTVSLVMTNPSSSGLSHGISVEGNGVDKDGPVAPSGKTSQVTAKLKPGTYTFYCPIQAHKAAGMKGVLVVR